MVKKKLLFNHPSVIRVALKEEVVLFQLKDIIAANSTYS